MATNRDLLKEAIADAKAVKDMAIANAKQALEEAFTPQLKDMLSAKLHEMEKKDEMEEGMDAMYDEDDMDHMNEEEVEEELDLDELLAELEEAEDETVTEAKDEEAEEEEEAEAEEGEAEESVDLEDMSEEDLKKFIEDVIADMVEAGELEAGEAEVEGEEDMEGEDMEMEMGDEVEAMEEDVNIDELLAEILAEEEDLGEISEDVTSFLMDMDGVASTAQAIASMAAAAGGVGLGYLASWWKEKAKGKTPPTKSEVEAASKKAADMEKSSDKSPKLAEALSRIETLEKTIEIKDEALNEVNLLNAKLLYTNKIFKSKTLTESQKAKVLTTFDKATNVNEVKLIHETLNNSLNTSRKPINESKGSASQVMGTTKTKSIINENDAFSRMRELAFYSQKH